ncbi:hypothetical protein [Novosphingobium arvoryzae]|uniref:Uncharacterized protein n=1 Tax=Novosphingobium arvoryzae TaxID=1256514 RepID=A0A918VMD3_9SPHN|nr:hypothetical protein [Novosphingobium arvoryzae]GHA08962.1 hypothetical protein GCM10011617_31660 [Novosphingobium arvoryzae]
MSYGLNRPVRPCGCFKEFGPCFLTHADLRQVYTDYLHEWLGTKKDDKKVGKPLTVAFDGINFAVGHEAFGHKSYAFGNKQEASVALQMRPRDVVDLFRKLVELNVSHVSLQGDLLRHSPT